jgi:hypothetical protein
VKQAKGSFAGEDAPVGQLPKDWSGSPGYLYLYDVQRDTKPPAAFTLDYKAEDRRGRIPKGADPHLRLACLTPCSEVALAHGDPPQNKSGNLRNLAYAILTRQGENLESLFTTVLEPYEGKPFIASARPLRVVSVPSDQLVGAVEVTLADGRVDTIVCCERPARVEVEGGVVLDGVFGLIARRGDKVEFAKLIAGTRLAAKNVEISCPAPFLSGKVVAINADNPGDSRVTVTLDRPADESLVGRVVIFGNDKAQDAAYTIRGLTKSGDRYEISTGDSTLVRGYSNPNDFEAGYTYNVRPGDGVRIPLSACVEGQ